jgi:hypothetical protein
VNVEEVNYNKFKRRYIDMKLFILDSMDLKMNKNFDMAIFEERISIQRAKEIIKEATEYVSVVRDKVNAAYLSEILGIDIEANQDPFHWNDVTIDKDKIRLLQYNEEEPSCFSRITVMPMNTLSGITVNYSKFHNQS